MTARRAGKTLASSAATAAIARIAPEVAQSIGNTTESKLVENTMYEPIQPNTVPTTMPTTPLTSEISSASMASERRSWLRVMPMARSVADSRVRSITDRDSVLATPISAMITATASRATSTMSSMLTMPSQDTRSAIDPPTVMPGMELTACWMSSITSAGVTVPSVLAHTS